MRRREFLKLSGALGAGAAAGAPLLSGCSPHPLPGSGQLRATPTVCDMCFWKCAGRVYVEDDRPWKIVGEERDLHSGGRLCTRGTGGLGAYLDRDRLKRPLLRVAEGGQQRFREVSWEEALDFISQRLKAIAERHGPDRIALLHHGSGARHFEHLMKAFGSNSRAEPAFAQCRGPRDVAFWLTYGEGLGSPERTDMAHSRCIVLIGSHIGENLHTDLNTMTASWDYKSLILGLDRGIPTIIGRCVVLQRAKTPDV
jgi:thiosulfate reductase/polysulfide reductase chain A